MLYIYIQYISVYGGGEIYAYIYIYIYVYIYIFIYMYRCMYKYNRYVYSLITR